MLVPGGAITGAESVWISEGFYERCYRVAVDGTLAMCGVAIGLAFIDEQSSPAATVAVSVLLATAALVLRSRRGYRWLRFHPSILALAGPVAVATALWPAVDDNALYFPVLGALAIVACVASHRREAVTVITSVALGTCLAALLDYRNPSLSSSTRLTTDTIGAIVFGVLVIGLIDWCAGWVLDEARASAPPDIDTETPQPWATRRALAQGTDPDATLPAELLAETRTHAVARWVIAIRDKIVTAKSGDREVWVRVTGFRARQLQVLLLHGEGFAVAEIAAFLSIRPASVEKYASGGVDRRRTLIEAKLQARKQSDDPVGADPVRVRQTKHELATELVARYPDAEAVDELAEEVARRAHRTDNSVET